ncbi:MAG TPA: CBS domain-containing protein [Candidatus Polarisedimenticolia bacterium]|jgi:CBS domain-containing protein|nr:CBS domain-containing protein [Candidatus Polarisedimenticolia bacterium]
MKSRAATKKSPGKTDRRRIRKPAAGSSQRAAGAGVGKRGAAGLLAGDLMTRNPITVPDAMTVGELCDLFQERNINGAPVVDAHGQLVGVVAQDDIIYGAMGHPDRVESPAAAAAAAGVGTAATGPGASQDAGVARDDSPPRRRRRGMVAALRDRHLEAVPEVPRRPGERAFWADQRAKDDPMRMPVRAIMTSPAISAEETTPLTDLCHVMWSLRIHRVPILRGGKVTGIVSSMDLCRGILNGLIKV